MSETISIPLMDVYNGLDLTSWDLAASSPKSKKKYTKLQKYFKDKESTLKKLQQASI